MTLWIGLSSKLELSRGGKQGPWDASSLLLIPTNKVLSDTDLPIVFCMVYGAGVHSTKWLWQRLYGLGSPVALHRKSFSSGCLSSSLVSIKHN